MMAMLCLQQKTVRRTLARMAAKNEVRATVRPARYAAIE